MNSKIRRSTWSSNRLDGKRSRRAARSGQRLVACAICFALATVSSTLAFAQNAPLGTDAPNRSWEPKGAFAAALMPVVVNSLTDLFRSWFQLGVDKLKPGGTPSGSVNGMNAGDRVSPGPNNPGQVQPSRLQSQQSPQLSRKSTSMAACCKHLIPIRSTSCPKTVSLSRCEPMCLACF